MNVLLAGNFGLEEGSLGAALLGSLLFGAIGIVMTIVGFKLFDLFIKFDLEAEIAEKQNVAVAILCGAAILGIAIIMTAAII
jgi:uncharacterized membrane protein YjfL (UPF0719 family)